MGGPGLRLHQKSNESWDGHFLFSGKHRFDQLSFLVFVKDEAGREFVRALILACSVCFGDPRSLLSKGAFWGVVFLLGVTGCVLGAIAYIIMVWSRRASRHAERSEAS